MKKTLSLVLVIAMLCTAMLGVVSFAEDSEAEAPKLVISQASLKFVETVYLLIAVDYTAVYKTLDEAAAATTLSIKNKADANSNTVILQPDSSVAVPGCVCFVYKDLGAKNMGDELELQAINGKNDSDVKNYSILEYAISAKGYSDSLDLVCETMLAYGEAAQSAWDWTDKATYDLSKDWGIAVVKGSNEGKQIAEVNSEVTFTPNTDKTGSNAALYNMSAAKLASTGKITISENAQNYYFIGDKQLTVINLDTTTSDMVDGEYRNEQKWIDKDHKNEAVVKVHTSKSMTGSHTKPSGTDGVDYAYMYMQQYAIGNTSANTGVAYMNVVSGENGYIKIGSEGTQSFVWWVTATSKTAAKNAAATAGNKFTLALTLGKDGTANMTNGVMRIRGSHYNFFKIENKSGASTFYAYSGGKIQQELATLVGEAGVQKFATVYVVFDLENAIVSYYNESGALVYSVQDNAMLTAMNASSALIDWTQAAVKNQTSLIQRIKVFAGNIFE